METTKPVSKSRMVLTWMMMIGFTFAIATFFFIRGHNATAPDDESDVPQANPLFHAIFYLVLGVFTLGCSLGAYFLLLFTCFFTFDYSHSVWNSVKAKQYLFNIFVGVGLSLGIGFIVTAFLSPVLTAMGLPLRQASILPVLGVIIAFQLMQLWVLIWSPVEKRMIFKRLGAMGITPAQLEGAMLIGISNPASGMVKRFGSIEEDMGALWVVPDRLSFRGDVEQFDLARDQITEIERRADNRSSTVLAGIAHVVLHVRLPDGSIRQMRLHVEGERTLGGKRRAMDALAGAIDRWQQGVVNA